MQLEVGKKYRTRDGKTIVRIKMNDNDDCYPIKADVVKSETNYPIGYQLTFTMEGAFYLRSDQDSDDLVEEVTE